MATYIGIDNGLKGGIAIIDGAVTVHKMPLVPGKKGARGKLDEPALLALLAEVAVGDVFACIESVQAGPKLRALTALTFGYGHGLTRGILVALGIPYAIVRPKAWQRVMLPGTPKGQTKQASVIVAGQLFPGVRLRATDKCTTDDHNLADALLMAEYARRTYGRG